MQQLPQYFKTSKNRGINNHLAHRVRYIAHLRLKNPFEQIICIIRSNDYIIISKYGWVVVKVRYFNFTETTIFFHQIKSIAKL